MPTLIDLDGFATQVATGAQAGSGFNGTYVSVNNAAGISFSTAVKRATEHVASLKVVQDGVSATNVRRVMPASTRLVVGSFYFLVSAAPSVISFMHSYLGPTNPPAFGMDTTGHLFAQNTSGSRVTTSGTYATGAWHLFEYRADCSGTTFTIDWQVDGVAQTQVSAATQTAADYTAAVFGSGTTTHTLTIQFQDFVASATSGDYPIGAHIVLPLYPVGEGTETLGTTNKIQDEAAGQTNLWQKVDDWNGGLPNTTDYVTYASGTLGDAASNFTEWTLGSVVMATVWDVQGIIAGFASGTTANTADTQVLTGHAGTIIDHIGNLIDYSGSTTVLGYLNVKLARISGGWTPANLAASVIQWGRSTDTNPLPRLSAVMLEYASPPVNGTATPAAVAGTTTITAGTGQGAGVTTPSAVAGTTTIPAPTAVGTSPDATATPSAVAGTTTIGAPTVTGTAVAAPSVVSAPAAITTTGQGAAVTAPAAVVGSTTIPASTTPGTAVSAPSVVSGATTIDAPTVRGAAATAPSVVPVVATVPDPDVIATSPNATASPDTVELVATIPDPTISIGAFATPDAVELAVSVPDPTVTADAVALPDTIELAVVIPRVAAPETVLLTVTIPAPTVVTVDYVWVFSTEDEWQAGTGDEWPFPAPLSANW